METAAPAPVTQEPTKIPPPDLAGSQGSAALIDEPKKKEPVADDPYDFQDLEVAGKKQNLKFQSKDQLRAILQKALYADQVIKDASQAKRGAADLMQKLKTPQGLREVLNDPDINLDVKQFALDIVKEMMEDEKLTPEQKKLRELEKYRETTEAEKKRLADEAQQKADKEKQMEQAKVIRGQIIEAMGKYPDIPQTQATMDAVILNMRAGFKRFGKLMTADQAMTVYSQQYWNSFFTTFDKMTPEQITSRFGEANGKKVLDKIEQMKLNQLKVKTDPSKKVPSSTEEVKKKKSMTEKDFDKHFIQQLAGGL